LIGVVGDTNARFPYNFTNKKHSKSVTINEVRFYGNNTAQLLPSYFSIVTNANHLLFYSNQQIIHDNILYPVVFDITVRY
jgi:hypothetical protein